MSIKPRFTYASPMPGSSSIAAVKISQRQLEMALFHQSCAASLLSPGVIWLELKTTIEVSNRLREIPLRDENIAAVEVSSSSFRIDRNSLVQIAQRTF